MNPLEIKLAEKSLDLVMDFVRRIGGPAADEVGIDLGNRFRAWRIENAANIFKRTQRKLAEAGLHPTALPPRLFLPFIDAASVEDDESLQEMWAGLLATATQAPNSVPPAFVETLKQMTPDEARYIDKIYTDRVMHPHYPRLDEQLPHGIFTEKAGAPKGLSPETYERLGIIYREYGMTEEHGKPEVGSLMKFTKYGMAFLKACRGPRKSRS